MGYIEQVNRLNRFTERVTRLSTGAYSLWFRLMDIANSRYWPDWVRVGTRTLMELMSIDSEKTFHKIRKELIDAGLIVYKRGNRSKLPSYHINQLDENLQIIDVKNTDNTELDVKNTGNNYADNKLYVKNTSNQGGNKGSNKGSNKPENEIPSLDNYIYKDKDKDKDIIDITNVISKSSVEDEPQSPKIDTKEIKEFWNSHNGNMSKILDIKGERLRHVKARVREYSLDQLKEAILKAEASDFMNGKNDRGWTASFDWILKPSKFVKVLEGNYDNRAEKKPPVAKKPSLRNPPIDDDRLKKYQELEDSLFMNFKPRRNL